jgi:hypothetical protein
MVFFHNFCCLSLHIHVLKSCPFVLSLCHTVGDCSVTIDSFSSLFSEIRSLSKTLTDPRDYWRMVTEIWNTIRPYSSSSCKFDASFQRFSSPSSHTATINRLIVGHIQILNRLILSLSMVTISSFLMFSRCFPSSFQSTG